MGSQAIQAKLWGQQPRDWADIQEHTSRPVYRFVLDVLAIPKNTTLLDVGCGSGHFVRMAADEGATITGIDASEPLLSLAAMRVPEGRFLTGEMEELPFADASFDLVSGFNSFQYAANVTNALTEARRVLKPGGKLIAMIWGNREDCEAATYLAAVSSLLPPPPPGAPGPFALSENRLLEKTLQEVGLTMLSNTDVPAKWEYPDVATAIKGLMSAGPVARAVEHSGFDEAYAQVYKSVKPYTRDTGHVVFNNRFRVIVAGR